MRNCPICNREANITQEDNAGPFIVNCKRCSKYIIGGGAITYWDKNKNDQAMKKVSYWLQNRGNKKDPIEISKLRNLPNIIELPKPRVQADNLLLWIGINAKEYNSEVSEELQVLISVIGSNSEEEVKWIADHLKEEKFIDHNGFQVTFYKSKRNPPQDELNAVMTFKGWDRYYELLKPSNVSRLCFMAMQYNDPLLEKIYSEQIVKTLKQTGFDIKLLRETLKAGSIDDQLRVQIRRAKFILVDLTHDNEGAYWEAGFAEGLGKPVIYTCEKRFFNREDPYSEMGGVHFDANHHLTVIWEENDLEKAADMLKATIRATLPESAKMEDK